MTGEGDPRGGMVIIISGIVIVLGTYFVISGRNLSQSLLYLEYAFRVIGLITIFYGVYKVFGKRQQGVI